MTDTGGSRGHLASPSAASGRVGVRIFDTLDSTSLYARRLLESGDPPRQPTVIIAAQQTGGIGRRSKPWWSPRGGLWLTLIEPLPSRPHPIISLAAGIMIGQAIDVALARAASAARVQLKWPNDVMVGDRKIAGILTEIVALRGGACLLLGVGINANFSAGDLPPDVQSRAVTLCEVAHGDIDLPALQGGVLDALLTVSALAVKDPTGVPKAFAARLWGLGQPFYLDGADEGAPAGVIRGVASDGRLIVETATGLIKVVNAEA